MNEVIYVLAKLLFPHLPRDVRRRKFITFVTVVFIGLFAVGGIVLFVILTAKKSG